jgi:hypothetical protein
LQSFAYVIVFTLFWLAVGIFYLLIFLRDDKVCSESLYSIVDMCPPSSCTVQPGRQQLIRSLYVDYAVLCHVQRVQPCCDISDTYFAGAVTSLGTVDFLVWIFTQRAAFLRVMRR